MCVIGLLAKITQLICLCVMFFLSAVEAKVCLGAANISLNAQPGEDGFASLVM